MKPVEDRLRRDLDQLTQLLGDPEFGVGDTTIGAELELAIVDESANALPQNEKLLSAIDDSHIQSELDRFNIEINLDPVAIAGRPFHQIESQLTRYLKTLNAAAHEFDARLIPVGILPTLTEDDVQASAMSEGKRYQQLSEGLRALRGDAFHVDIEGQEHLLVDCEDVTIEGANTSMQIHLRVNPGEFADAFNAAQLATPFVMALSANSPVALQHLLWHETRIALFKQAVDYRPEHQTGWHRPNRVSFGFGWVRRSALELFQQNVALFRPLMDSASNSDLRPHHTEDGTPCLNDLRSHQGTVWHWNRPVYDPTSGGHLRI